MWYYIKTFIDTLYFHVFQIKNLIMRQNITCILQLGMSHAPSHVYFVIGIEHLELIIMNKLEQGKT